MAPPLLSCCPNLKAINNCFSSEYPVALTIRLEIKCDPFPVVRNTLLPFETQNSLTHTG